MSDSLTPTRLARIRDLFDGALDRDPEDRARWLERACGGDEALVAEVESLIAARARARATREPPRGAVVGE